MDRISLLYKNKNYFLLTENLHWVWSANATQQLNKIDMTLCTKMSLSKLERTTGSGVAHHSKDHEFEAQSLINIT